MNRFPHAPVLIVAMTAAFATAQSHREQSGRLEAPDLSVENDPATRNPLAQLTETGAAFKKLGDWQSQADLIDRFAGRLWKENGWNSEPDQFGLKITREVSSIPPWQFHERVRLFTDRVGERYGLNRQQTSMFRAQVYRESLGMFAKNAGPIVKQITEIVEKRAVGQPFTAEDVQRWTEESEPMVSDIVERMNRLGEHLEKDLDESNRRLLQADRVSLNKRLQHFIKMREQWSAGGWKPEHWGLESDPIQAGDASNAEAMHNHEVDQLGPAAAAVTSKLEARDAARAAVAPERAATLAGADTEWRRFVREFIEAHTLDPGQRDAIYSILIELEERATRYEVSNAEALTMIPPSEFDTHALREPIRQMFEELKTRAEALLTESQLAAIPKPR
jgi:hypothetical protein